MSGGQRVSPFLHHTGWEVNKKYNDGTRDWSQQVFVLVGALYERAFGLSIKEFTIQEGKMSDRLRHIINAHTADFTFERKNQWN